MQATAKLILPSAIVAAALGAAASPSLADAKRSAAPASAARCVAQLTADDDPIVIALPNGGKIWIFDRDGDKRVDGIVIDSDGDGNPDAAASDCDRDGVFDTFWTDRNRNGTVDPDEVKRKPRPGRTIRVGDGRCHAVVTLKRRGLRPRRVVAHCATAPRQPAVTAPEPPAATITAPEQRPATVTAPAQPAIVTPLTLAADIDGDGELERLELDGALAPSGSSGRSQDADGDIDVVRVGGAGGATVAGAPNLDNDPKDDEVVVEDPNILPNQSYGLDLDGDGDPDVIVIGTKGGATLRPPANVDNDPTESEIVVEDPNLLPNQSYGLDLDGDGDNDVIVVGTKS